MSALSVSPHATSAGVGFPELQASREIDRVLLARRISRVGFGAVLVIAGVPMGLNAGLGAPVHPATFVFAAWLTAFAVMGTLHVLAHLSMVIKDPGRLDDHHLAASIAWPVSGLVVLLPFTLHVLMTPSSCAGSSTLDGSVAWTFLAGLSCFGAVLVLWCASRIIARERVALAVGV